MFLSVITVAFRNYEGVVKPALAAQPARDPSLTFEWIVVDGGSNDGTAEFWKNSTVSSTYVTSARKIKAFTMP